MSLLKLKEIKFPKSQGIMINMMPIIVGDLETLPMNLHPYDELIQQCGIAKGQKAYLSINESLVQQGETQRRSGIHTDGTADHAWGNGPWGGGKAEGEGIWMASSDGQCRAWNCQIHSLSKQGTLHDEPFAEEIKLQANTLYWMTDRTPHESLPAEQTQVRQWFRLVADKIGIWFSKHSTANPFGIQPNAPISHEQKF